MICHLNPLQQSNLQMNCNSECAHHVDKTDSDFSWSCMIWSYLASRYVHWTYAQVLGRYAWTALNCKSNRSNRSISENDYACVDDMFLWWRMVEVFFNISCAKAKCHDLGCSKWRGGMYITYSFFDYMYWLIYTWYIGLCLILEFVTCFRTTRPWLTSLPWTIATMQPASIREPILLIFASDHFL